jgi:hypothetical protein
MASFARIALAGGSFVKVEFHSNDDVLDLVKRACAEFPHWGTADMIFLSLVAGGGNEPTEEVISAVLSSGRRLDASLPLECAGVSTGAWLVARRRTAGASPTTLARSHNSCSSRSRSSLPDNPLCALTNTHISHSHIPSTEQTPPPIGTCTPLSADLIFCLPSPLASWLTQHSKRRIIGSLLLFCMWETASSLLPQEWKMWGFPVLGVLLLSSLGFWMDDRSMTATWVVTSLVTCSILGWAALKVGGAP